MNEVLFNLLKDYDLVEQQFGIVNGSRATWVHLKVKKGASMKFNAYEQEKFYFEVDGWITMLSHNIAKWVLQQCTPQEKKNFGKVTIK